MPGQVIGFFVGALATMAALIWLAFSSTRAVIRDYRRRTSAKKEAERKAFLERKAEVERKARQQL